MSLQKKKSSIVKKMIISVAAGFAVGFLCLFLKSMLMGTDGEGVWKVVDAIFSRILPLPKALKASACSTL